MAVQTLSVRGHYFSQAVDPDGDGFVQVPLRNNLNFLEHIPANHSMSWQTAADEITATLNVISHNEEAVNALLKLAANLEKINFWSGSYRSPRDIDFRLAEMWGFPKSETDRYHSLNAITNDRWKYDKEREDVWDSHCRINERTHETEWGVGNPVVQLFLSKGLLVIPVPNQLVARELRDIGSTFIIPGISLK